MESVGVAAVLEQVVVAAVAAAENIDLPPSAALLFVMILIVPPRLLPSLAVFRLSRSGSLHRVSGNVVQSIYWPPITPAVLMGRPFSMT
jgi:hypothetical protein